MTTNQLAGHKVLFTAPILPQTVGVAKTDDEYVNPKTGPVDAIDWNSSGSLDCAGISYPWYSGKGGDDINGRRGAKGLEPSIVSPSLEQMKAYAKELDVEILGSEQLPNGILVGESSPTGTLNIRPIEDLVYKATSSINPKATWAIDTVNNQFIVFEK